MFRQMRRSKQALSAAECDLILQKASSGVLAVAGDMDYPYAVPLNYVYGSGNIYFHWAKNGHKLDSIKKNSKVSFCVCAEDTIIPEEFTSYFSSVIVFGKAKIIGNDMEKEEALKLLCSKYSPGFEEKALKEIERFWDNVLVIKLVPEHISGKKAIELFNKHNAD